MSQSTLERTHYDSDANDRSFSNELSSQFGPWTAEIERNSLEQLANSELWHARLDRIIAEASFLGFSQILQLCKALRAAHKSIADNVSAFDETHLVQIINTWKYLSSTVANPSLVNISKDLVLIRDLQQQFSLSDESISSFIKIHPITDFSAWVPESSPKSENAQHVDCKVYRNSEIDMLDRCSEEESWIAAQLVDLAEDIARGQQSERPATRLYNLLRRHRFFHGVDRVCLAGRVANSNQLVVLDSAISERCIENKLRKGYSCFVNPQGSLFNLKPSTVRVFADSNSVVTSFSERKKPVQRSIALIAEQGLRSGMCMAIGRGSHIQGFMFFNSKEPNLFDDITVKFAPLLSLFSIVGTVAFDTNGFHIENSDPWNLNGLGVPQHAIRFDSANLTDMLSSVLSNATISLASPNVDLRIADTEFLYPPQLVIGCLLELWNRIGLFDKESKALHLVVDRSDNRLKFSFEHSPSSDHASRWPWIQHTIESMQKKFSNKPISFALDASRITISTPFEPTLAESIDQAYSIVF